MTACVVLDVSTDRPFGGNQLAAIADVTADGAISVSGRAVETMRRHLVPP